MVKPLQKYSTPEPVDLFQPNLVCSIGESWVDLDIFYGKVIFWNVRISVGKSENIGFFINHAAFGLKVDGCRQFIEFMKVFEY